MDLIDRSEVQYKMLEILPEADSLEWYESAKPDEVKELVDELYSIVLNVNQIDAQPVKHGKWRKRMSTPDSVKCCLCGYASVQESSYCGRCGAFMRGDAE